MTQFEELFPLIIPPYLITSMVNLNLLKAYQPSRLLIQPITCKLCNTPEHIVVPRQHANGAVMIGRPHSKCAHANVLEEMHAATSTEPIAQICDGELEGDDTFLWYLMHDAQR